MRISCAILSLAVVSPAMAICPMGRRALEDPGAFNSHFEKRDATQEKRQTGPGGLPFTTFNENQLVDVTGTHKWVAPGPNDIRGPCPGLNALANHGYFPHSGVVPLTTAATATNQVYGKSSGYQISWIISWSSFLRSCTQFWRSSYCICNSGRWWCCVCLKTLPQIDLAIVYRLVADNHGASDANRRRPFFRLS